MLSPMKSSHGISAVWSFLTILLLFVKPIVSIGAAIGSPYVQVVAGRWIEVDGNDWNSAGIPDGSYTITYTLDSSSTVIYSWDVTIYQGNFVNAAQIPSNTPTGLHTITAHINGVTASFSIQVCGATATCNPLIGFLDTNTNFATTASETLQVGSQFILVGNGFAPGETIQLWIDRWFFLHGEQLGTAYADPNGFFRSQALGVPFIQSGLPLYGEHILSAVGVNDEATLWFTIDAIPR